VTRLEELLWKEGSKRALLIIDHVNNLRLFKQPLRDLYYIIKRSIELVRLANTYLRLINSIYYLNNIVRDCLIKAELNVYDLIKKDIITSKKYLYLLLYSYDFDSIDIVKFL